MSEESLRAVAAGTAGTGELRLLSSAQRSLQLLILRALLDRVRAAAPTRGKPPLSADSAWSLLTAVQEADPGAFEAVVMDPFVRAWASRLLRRLEGVPTAGRSGPLWADLGQFDAMAAAAAVRAGFATEVWVPVYRGTAWLPGTGVADGLSPRRWSRALVRVGPTGSVVRGERAEVRLPAPQQLSRSARGWRPAHLLMEGSAPTGDSRPAPELRLDCMTPYRDMVVAVRSPGRVSAEEVKTWTRRVNGAWELLVRDSPAEASALASLVRCLVPRPAPSEGSSQVASASSADASGAVTMSLPPDDAGTAAVLVHETRHQQLNALLSLTPLLEAAYEDTEGDERRRPFLHYSPWRSTPRPAQGLLHGIFAFAGVAGFWRSYGRTATASQARRAHFEFAVLREQLHDAVAALGASGELTAAGLVFADEIGRVVECWRQEPVPAETARLAKEYVTTRRAMWRVRHMDIGRQAAERLATAWRLAQSPPPLPPSVLRPSLDASHEDSRRTLTELYLRAPGAFDRLRRQAERAGDHARAGEAATIAADYAEAAECYARMKAADQADPEAWIGASLVAPEAKLPAAGGLLLGRPEVVAGLYDALASAGGPVPDPARLAEWLTSG